MYELSTAVTSLSSVCNQFGRVHPVDVSYNSIIISSNVSSLTCTQLTGTTTSAYAFPNYIASPSLPSPSFPS